jgi:hypothetical protein
MHYALVASLFAVSVLAGMLLPRSSGGGSDSAGCGTALRR